MFCHLEIIDSPMPEPIPDKNWYRIPDQPRQIDTVVIHYTGALGWFNEGFQKAHGQEVAPLAAEFGLTPENIAEHKFNSSLAAHILSLSGSITCRIDKHHTLPKSCSISQTPTWLTSFINKTHTETPL